MTYIIDFIKEHEDWETLLTKAPYFIKIKRDKELPHLVSLSYSQIESDFSLPLVRECRGIIIDVEDTKEPRVVCHAMDKFFNYGESNAAEIDWSSAKVYEKIDGSLLKLWYYNKAKRWILSSNSCIQAKDAKLESGHDLEELFLYAIKEYMCDTIDTFARAFHLFHNFTYCFELISPYNQVVIQYPKAEIYLLAGRDLQSEKEYTVDELIDTHFNLFKLHRPACFNLSSLEECVKFLSTFNSGKNVEHEGFVITDKYYNRIKIKTEEYVAMHHAANGLSEEEIIRIIRANEISEVLAYFPKYEYKIKEMLRDYGSYLKKLFVKTITARKTWERLNKDRKAFALVYKNKNFPEVFKLLDMDWDWRKYLDSLTEKQLLKNIKRAN